MRSWGVDDIFSASHCLMVATIWRRCESGDGCGLAGCLVQTAIQQADHCGAPQASLIASVAELPAKFAWSSRT